MNRTILTSFLAVIVMLPGMPAAAQRSAEFVEVVVHLDQPTRAISPYIYGTNLHGDIDGFDFCTAMRNGGNPNSTYNWENNTNNAGSDWHHANVTWVSRFVEKTPLMQQPAAAIRHFHELARQRGAYDLVQVPMIDYVAADREGPVTDDQKAPSHRWKRLELHKPGPLSDTPDPDDDVVYVDEMIAHLVKLYGRADAGGIRGYCLDNEPDWWNQTHRLVHPEPITCNELIQKNIAWATTIKQLDPSAEVFGFSPTHMMGYHSLNNASDWPQIRERKNYDWFLDYYLDEMRAASDKAGQRLLDVLELHSYTDSEIVRAGGFEAVLQGPRWYWDPTYRQPSWIGEVFPQHLPLLPKVRRSIEKYFPGTKLAITEYCGQLSDTIYGSLAQADTLGVFGREGVYLATLWSQLGYEPHGERALPLLAAFRLYLDFDGNGARFGDQSIEVTNPRPDLLSVYAARNSKTGHVHLIVIGKTRHVPTQLTIRLTGDDQLVRAERWGYDDSSYHIRFLDEPTLADGRMSVVVPRFTARHIVLSKSGSGYQRPGGN